MNPYRFGLPPGRTLPRWVAAAVLCGVAAGVPIIPAIAIGTGENTAAWAAPIIRAIGALPAVLLALLLALRPRTADQVAGGAIFELLLMVFSYGTVFYIFAD